MYRRIEELAEGKVHTKAPILDIAPERMNLELMEGGRYSGSFTITSVNLVPAKGTVYASDQRMEIKNPQFQGMEVEIHYEFNGKDMQEGESLWGSFYVISNGGEYELPWSLTVRRLYAEASIGRIASLDDFLRLYEANWRESIHVFSAPAFRRLLTGNERLYYKLLSGKPVSPGQIEEFLVACGKKERVTFALSKREAAYPQLLEPVEEILEIVKQQWGYLRLSVSCDADFVILEKEQIDHEDFNGERIQLRYRIYPEHMHAGKNYARITVSSQLQQEIFEISASKPVVLDLSRDDRRRKMKENLRLSRDYEAFLAGEMVLGQWSARTTACLKNRENMGESEPLDRLWCAYAYLLNRQKQEAQWILEAYRREHGAGDWRERAFFLYLRTLTEKEPTLLEKLQQGIRDIYRENSRDPWVRFVMMQAAEKGQDVSSRQLGLLEQWYVEGMKSPFLYAFAADIYGKEPYLLQTLGDFQIHVLRWVSRHHRLTRDLAEQIIRRTVNIRNYSRLLDELLEDCYEAFPQEEMLAGLCAYRIKGARFGQDMHPWYELAIEHDLQITGLYEAFMASLDSREVKQLPRSVQLYFQYNNHLTYRQKAVLYVSIIANRKEQEAVYERYRQIIQDFAEEEMLAGHMDDNLAIVYEHALEHMTITPKLARALSKLLYMNKFTCLEEPVARVILQQENLKNAQSYPVVGHQAYFPIYPGNYVIVLEDASGRRYGLSAGTQLERLMNPGRYIRKCLELAPGELPFVLHHMNGKTKLLHLDEKMAGYVRTLVYSDAISEEFKSRISPGFLEYCRGEGFDGDIREYVRGIDFGRLDRGEKDRHLQSLIRLHMYQEAWEFLLQYGPGGLSEEDLCQVVLAQLQAEGMQEDAWLLSYAMRCFLGGCKDRQLLGYLCGCCQGPVKHMVQIWRAAMEQRLPADDLEERILVQMVFSGTFTADTPKVFRSYCSHPGREQVRLAYLTCFSYEAFFEGRDVEPELYTYLEQETLKHRRVNEYLRLALLRYYSRRAALTLEQERFVDDMLDEYIAKDTYFPCFLKLPMRVRVRHQLYDLCAIEYRSVVSGAKVWVDYRINPKDRDFTRVELTAMAEGLYPWHVRLLGGEQLEYYITEKSERMETVTKSRLLVPEKPDVPDDRYGRLYRMAEQSHRGAEEELRAEMEQYQALGSLTDKLFRIR